MECLGGRAALSLTTATPRIGAPGGGQEDCHLRPPRPPSSRSLPPPQPFLCPSCPRGLFLFIYFFSQNKILFEDARWHRTGIFLLRFFPFAFPAPGVCFQPNYERFGSFSLSLRLTLKQDCAAISILRWKPRLAQGAQVSACPKQGTEGVTFRGHTGLSVSKDLGRVPGYERVQ